MPRFICLIAFVLVAMTVSQEASAQSKLWPFGGGNETTAQPAAPPAAAAVNSTAAPAEAEGNWLVKSPLLNVGWPKVEMPSMPWSQPAEGAVPTDGNFITRPLNKAADATKNFAQKTRTKWNQTIDKIKLPSMTGPKTGNGEPGFFAKLFTPVEEKQGAETVSQFLAQERPGKTGY